MGTLCPYLPSLSPLAFGHLPLTRGVGPLDPHLRESLLKGVTAFSARKI